MKIAVLGAGLIGTAIAIDLSQEEKFQVISVDINEQNLHKLQKYSQIKKLKEDISDFDTLKNIVDDCDYVINALPSNMGYKILKNLILCKKNVVDITFFEEDPFTLSELAEQNNVTAVVDCGIAPGMSNILSGFIEKELDETKELYIYVGGIPSKKNPPWDYKAVFAPKDVINEYMRPARFVINGELVIKEALSEPEPISFEGHGTFEAFNTDGLRTLINTLSIKDMREKTIRYPGHIDRIKVLKECGLFDENQIEINGIKATPLEMTSEILFPQWKMNEDDRDKTLFRIVAKGTKDKKEVKYMYNLVDEYDEESNIHSMARTTGYTATAVARLLSEGLFNKKGIVAPEFIGREKECVEFILAAMKKKGIDFQLTIDE